MAESIFDREPGTGTTSALADVLGEEVINLTISALPPDITGALDKAKAVGQQAAAIGTALSSAAGMGPLAIATAVYQGLQAVNSAVQAWADLINSKWQDQIAGVVGWVCADLCKNANGRILAVYQPSDEITLERPRGYEGKSLKDKEWTCEKMRGQYRSGYVACLGRPTKSAILYTPIPILVPSGGIFDVQEPASIWGPSGPGVYPSKELIPENWSEYKWWGLRANYLDSFQKWEWVARLIAQNDANPAPPVRTWTTVAPGLAPTWGPQGQGLPTSPYALGYVSGLLARPAPDLDAVAKILSTSEQTPRTAQVRRTTELLLWTREDLRRRKLAPGQPEGSAWRDRLYPADAQGQGQGQGGGGFGGGVGGLSGGATGGDGGGLLVGAAALGLGYLLMRGRRR